MPFLIRILIQRTLIIGLSTLAFFGVNPDINIPTTEEAQIKTEERQEIVRETIGITDNEVEPRQNIIEQIIPKEIKTNIVQKEDIILSSLISKKETEKTVEINIPKQIIQEKVHIATIEPPKAKTAETAEKKETKTTTKISIPDTSSENTIENATVNIICVRQEGMKTHITSGSGVIISPEGVVITNSHIAQHFLLKNVGNNCSLRKENIPLYGFTAEPIYISEQWIEDNYKLISHSSPTGTGEGDYALLKITGNTNPVLEIPSSFAYINPDIEKETIKVGDQITAAGYPGRQYNINLNNQLSLEIDKTSVERLFTLGKDSIDAFATENTSVAEIGSSGGGIFRDGKLIGLISTINSSSYGKGNVINAITLDYINRNIKRQTGKSLSSYLSGDLEKLMQNFQSSVAPHLTELLLRNL